MNEAKRWSVVIDIDEHDGRTRAVARLHTRDTDSLVGVGLARLNPDEPDVPEIGDELAVARALSELGHLLLSAAADDIESATRAPAHVKG
jgi:Rv2632c-like